MLHESATTGELFTVFFFNEIGEGTHNFTIMASDADGSTARSETIVTSKTICSNCGILHSPLYLLSRVFISFFLLASPPSISFIPLLYRRSKLPPVALISLCLVFPVCICALRFCSTHFHGTFLVTHNFQLSLFHLSWVFNTTSAIQLQYWWWHSNRLRLFCWSWCHYWVYCKWRTTWMYVHVHRYWAQSAGHSLHLCTS